MEAAHSTPPPVELICIVIKKREGEREKETVWKFAQQPVIGQRRRQLQPTASAQERYVSPPATTEVTAAKDPSWCG